MNLIDRDLDIIEVSDKHVPLRIAAFALAFILAVSAFAFGVAGLGHKNAGYYNITPSPNDEAPLYAANVSLRCWFDGESEGIKASLARIQPVYDAALLESCKLLDARSEYLGVNNVASLNAKIGEPLSLDPRLYEILLDAYAKTQEGRGYNLFAGPLYAEWTTLLYLEDPAAFDPLNDPEEAARLEKLCALAGDLSLYRLSVVDEESHTLRFDVEESVLRELEAMEIDAPILDLNLLHDAYRLELAAQALEEAGFHSGYLSSDSGLSLSLSEMKTGEFRLYAFDGENAEPAAAVIAEGGTAASQFHVFPYSDEAVGYYAVTDESGTLHFRHPYLPADGVYREKLQSSLVVDLSGNLVNACYRNLCLNSMDTQRESRQLASKLDCPVVFTVPDGGKTVYVNAASRDLAAADTDYGYKLEEIA